MSTSYATTTLNAVVYPRLALVYKLVKLPIDKLLKSIELADIPRNSNVLPDDPAVPLLPAVPEVPVVPDDPAVPLVAPKTYDAVIANDAVIPDNKDDPVNTPSAFVYNAKLLPLIYISSHAEPSEERCTL